VALVRALALEPGLADAWLSAGALLRDQGELEGARTCVAHAAALRGLPAATVDEPAAHGHGRSAGDVSGLPGNTLAVMLTALATTLSHAGPFATAIALFRRAIELDDRLAAAHANLGAVLLKADSPDAGMDSLRRALELNPNDAASHLNLGSAMFSLARHGDGLEELRRAIALKPGDPFYGSHLVFNMHFVPDVAPEAILAEARAWGTRHAGPRAGSLRPLDNIRAPDRRLRVGYVSPDFRMHCQRFFTVPLFRAHDRTRVEVYCYSNVAVPDGMTDRIRGLVDGWRDISRLDDRAADDCIRRDHIDVLVDLTMHMDRNRLPVFALRPAPVQVAWLAYPGTTGLPGMDYRVTDRYLDPDGADMARCYSEASIRLPDTFWCYDPLTNEPDVGPLPATRNEAVQLACLNNFCKTNEATLELWARVLREVPRSRLLLAAPDGEARTRALQVFTRCGVEPSRIDFQAIVPHEEYLATYRRIDVCLDPHPYNGHTTSLDAFFMGVPVVTLEGQTVVGRAGLCHAMNLGLPELVAKHPDDYVRIAVQLAGDPGRLAVMRSGLRDRMARSPLMDAPRFARNIEAAYRHAWQRWCRGEGAADFDVAALTAPGT
jgi:predicted O-linked N-acetylglucosamine transferase (SPINDLY family)